MNYDSDDKNIRKDNEKLMLMKSFDNVFDGMMQTNHFVQSVAASMLSKVDKRFDVGRMVQVALATVNLMVQR